MVATLGDDEHTGHLSEEATMAKVLESSFELATKLIGAMSMSAREYEETLTGMLLGSLLTSNTLLTLVSAHLDIEPTQCWRGSYSKYNAKDNPFTEAKSGADFGLLTLLANGGARLALFQAKRGILDNGIWTVDVNQTQNPPKSEATEVRGTQMVVLVDTGRQLSQLADPSGRRSKNCPPLQADAYQTPEEIEDADLQSFDWVHYLVYTDEGADCLPLRLLSRPYIKELDGRNSKTEIPIAGRTFPFTQVVSEGCAIGGRHWLEFDDAKAAIDALPLLLPLVPMIVGDADGTSGPALQRVNGLAPLSLNLSNGPVAEFVAALNANPGGEGYQPTRRRPS